jgi:hypothetical protein
MFNLARAQRARIASSAVPALAPRLTPRSDLELAPITFASLAYTPTDGPPKHYHMVPLYRLDRVGILGPNAGLLSSEHYGIAAGRLAESLRLREMALLLKLPTNYRWLAAEVIEDMPPTAATPTAGIKPPATQLPAPKDRDGRLRYAHLLAADILLQRKNA